MVGEVFLLEVFAWVFPQFLQFPPNLAVTEVTGGNLNYL